MIFTPRAQDASASIQQCIQSGRYPEAIRACSRALAVEPHLLDVRAMLGAAFTRAGRPEEALPHLNRVFKETPRDPNIARELAIASMHCGRLDAAGRLLEKALKRTPSNPELLLTRARWATLSGKPELARSLAITVRRSNAHRADAAIALAHACEQIGSSKYINEGIGAIQPFAAALSLAGRTRALVLFQLARLLEAQGEYNKSIAALHEANALVRTPFDINQLRGAVDRMLHAELPEALPSNKNDGVKPVLIVGMPRTGSTLVERIIGAHPAAESRGETGLLHRLLYNNEAITKVGQDFVVPTHPHKLTTQSIDSIRDKYFHRTTRADIITDKDLHNFLHLGVLSRILPEARIIRCVRNPVDTCFSCYSHHFLSGMPYAQQFEDLAAFSKIEQRVWEHWSNTLDMPMLEVTYEQLVREPDRIEHEIVRFVGLDWHANCAEPHRHAPASVTASTHQTRKPIYTSSVARAERFGGALDNLRACLDADEPAAPAERASIPSESGWIAQLPALANARRRG